MFPVAGCVSLPTSLKPTVPPEKSNILKISASVTCSGGIPNSCAIASTAVENMAAKAGAVINPELRKIAVKITKARQKYRRDMTGKFIY